MAAEQLGLTLRELHRFLKMPLPGIQAANEQIMISIGIGDAKYCRGKV